MSKSALVLTQYTKLHFFKILSEINGNKNLYSGTKKVFICILKHEIYHHYSPDTGSVLPIIGTKSLIRSAMERVEISWVEASLS